ncbi:MAG: release factor glutamine methyltransferase, partial [Solirubrobacteraceae bacterium]|nr:release factor glutamine methyltransferase [Solirubrobacteraceae bacterium]
GAAGPWDAVVANPPYVAEDELSTLAPEIHHEPRAALEAGEDGLEVISRLVPELSEAGVPWVALEVGLGQAAAVREGLAGAGYARIEARDDLAGIPRVVVARRT